jgi:predicted MFS family arabinose efflux permease
MDQIFPGANIVAGVLVLLIGFGIHFCAQLISVIDWELGTRLGLQETGMRPEHKNYEHAIAVADSLIGWTYGIAGVGLIIDASWGYAWAWIPGAILTYHALQFWFWTANHKKSGDHYSTTKNPMRWVWAAANLVTGVLTLLVANSQMIVP